MKKLILIFIAVSISSISYGQVMDYKLTKDTNQITDINVKLSYKMEEEYNTVTKIHYNFKKINIKIFIKINSNGEGEFKMYQPINNKNWVYTIETCYQKTFSNSSGIYLKLNCKSENDKPMTFYIDTGSDGHLRVWFEPGKNERIYYYN